MSLSATTNIMVFFIKQTQLSKNDIDVIFCQRLADRFGRMLHCSIRRGGHFFCFSPPFYYFYILVIRKQYGINHTPPKAFATIRRTSRKSCSASVSTRRQPFAHAQLFLKINTLKPLNPYASLSRRHPLWKSQQHQR